MNEKLKAIHDKGWMSVCHFDYLKDGILWTFCSFAKCDYYVRGDAQTYEEALGQVLDIINSY